MLLTYRDNGFNHFGFESCMDLGFETFEWIVSLPLYEFVARNLIRFFIFFFRSDCSSIGLKKGVYEDGCWKGGFDLSNEL